MIPPWRKLRACLLSVAFVARRSRASSRSDVLDSLLVRIVSLVGRAGWAGSVGRWVDTGMNLRVRPPQIEAHGLAFALKCTEMCCREATRGEPIVRREGSAIDRCVVEI